MSAEKTQDQPSGFECGAAFIVFNANAKALKEYAQMGGDAESVVKNAFNWFVGLPFVVVPDSLAENLFRQLQNGCRYSAEKFKAGKAGGKRSGEVRTAKKGHVMEYREKCRAMVFNGVQDIRGALSCNDGEVALQAVLEWCGKREDNRLANALRKRLKTVGAVRFGELCDKVITTEQEPKKRAAAIVGVLDNAISLDNAVSKVGG